MYGIAETLVIGPGTYQMDNSLVVSSGVTVRGAAGRTILRKSRGVESPLAEDGDYGETYLRVTEPGKFRPGMGVSILDDTLKSGWDISVTTLTEVNRDGAVRVEPMTLRDYDHERLHAKIRNTFPILCAMDAENVVFEDLIVDGNKEENAYLDGCRGGAIYLYHVRNAIVRNCVARNYNGDGISFQITDGVQVLNCESHGHTGYGAHPGTGSARPVVRNCRLHHNGQVGLFLCWRVRHGQFTGNVREDNGRYGISIGHKDTDNEFVSNTVARNGFSGVYFRNESEGMAGHRNRIVQNRIEDNGAGGQGAGIFVDGETDGVVLVGNTIRDTRQTGARTQRTGIRLGNKAGKVTIEDNRISAEQEIEDLRTVR